MTLSKDIYLFNRRLSTGCQLCGPGSHQPLAGQPRCLPCEGGARGAVGGVGALACPPVGAGTTEGRVGVEVAVPPGAYNQSQLVAAVYRELQVWAGLFFGKKKTYKCFCLTQLYH